MKKLEIIVAMLFISTFSGYAELITMTASADASNNTLGRFIEYGFTFDTEQNGYYTIEGSQPTALRDLDGYDFFYAHLNVPFILPVSDFVPQNTLDCGFTDLNNSLTNLLMCVNGNMLSISGNSITDWQIGSSLEGLERVTYLDDSKICVVSNLTITNIMYGGSNVPEPSVLPMFIFGVGFLSLYFFSIRKRDDNLKKAGNSTISKI